MRWGGKGNGLATLVLSPDATLRDALVSLNESGESILFVGDPESRAVQGTLTDGDVRRALLAGASLDDTRVLGVMQRDFVSVSADAGRAEVLDLMAARGIGQVPVIDEQRRLCGLHTIGRLLSADERPNAAVLLAGGRGTRLAPLTHTVPKPMVPVAGRPILERLILHLMSSGIRRFYLSVNYLAHVIEEHFGDGSQLGCEIIYLRESQPLGTGGPVALVDPLPEAPVIVMNGDLVTQCDVGAMLDFHSAGGYSATIGVREYVVEIPFGTAEIDGDRLTALREKPVERKLVNSGIYVLGAEAIARIPRDQEYPITSLFEACLEAKLPVGAFRVTDEWLDVGRPEELRRARGLL